MELSDLFLTPIYLGVFYGIAFAIRPSMTNRFTKKYFIPALTLKFIGALALGLIYQFYYTGGDTFNYYGHIKVVYSAFADSPLIGFKLLFAHGQYDPDTAGYANQMHWYTAATEYFIIKIGAVCALLCFDSYSVIALMFAGISFAGLWAMYTTFLRIFPLAYKKLAIAMFFLPSVFFWGSGLLKDSICIGALGWAFYGFYHVFIIKKYIKKASILGLIGIYILISVKIYILLSFLPPALFWIFNENNQRIKSATTRALMRPVFILLGVAAGYLGATRLTAGDERYDVDKIGERTKINQEYLYNLTKENGSSYSIGTFDGSARSLLLVAPQAVVVSLFRPFVFEARSPIMLLSALEAALFLYLTISLIVRTGIFKSIHLISTEPILSFCFIFSIIFAIGVGTNSGNFGTLVRYKIPLMPFFLSALYIMQFKADELKYSQLNKPKKFRRLAVTE
ncbi:MAG: hypothetical protein ACRYG7_50495 [Janthinobacterium lividum]